MEKNAKMLKMSHHHHPNDLQQKKTFTPSRNRGKSSCVQLFSPAGKSAGQYLKEDNTLEVRSLEYMTSISCIKHDLMIAAHQFLCEKSPKDYTNKLWSVIQKNNLLVEKQAIAASTEDPESFFTIMLKFFLEFSDGSGSPYKPHCMLAHFSAVNCIAFSEVRICLLLTYFLFFPDDRYIICMEFTGISSSQLQQPFPFP